VQIQSFAPGRVNIIGEHTDYCQGFALPMAIDLGVTLRGKSTDAHFELTTDADASHVRFQRGTVLESGWGRYVSVLAQECGARFGISGALHADLPVGSGLSSSAALGICLAQIWHPQLETLELAELAQRSETVATGVQCGLMDQLASAGGQEGHALLIDFSSLAVRPISISEDIAWWVLHSGQQRQLEHSGYGQRRAEVEQVLGMIGSFRDASIADIARLPALALRRRARHVITENQRVLAMVDALAHNHWTTAGQLLNESHQSLRDDFEVSTPTIDELWTELNAHPKVYGARLTGAGFGGCLVAMTEPDADLSNWGADRWRVHPSRGAWVEFS
jgi:galactokinase